MLIRNLLFSIVMGLIACPAVLAQPGPEAQAANQQKAGPPPAEASQPIVVAPPKEQAKVEAPTDVATERSKDRDEYLFWGDGVAQWVMAITGVLALVVSGWAVWLLNRTLAATRDAVRSADDAVAATREFGSKQLRAWISFNHWHLESAFNDIGVIHTFAIVLNSINTGSTPALKVRAITRRKDDSIFANEEAIFSSGSWSTSVVGPSLPFVTKFLITPDDLFRSFDEPISIRCVIQYDTIFDDQKDRITANTFEIQYVGNASFDQLVIPGIINQNNISFRPIGPNDYMT